ncbi:MULTISPECIES: AraC family transcriptional regulator [unclassified Fusibacter]|uniref:AraC family transcriptional regulator n=1 Tax=unclassified Fusibacter TaxID=2624464 RepID=UPI0013E92402|nr:MULTISPECIES: AraC family transcriptional regulator [unclassified Fusibacter]MCK8060111.1 AraC family transcriptional regulator [Fusibacter sp. A2]NPE22253.1 AraC family transcriptional regulator [Fusibacter sp. A1]
MDYKKNILKVTDYIEGNLEMDLSIDSCARISGYSKYHFIRIFIGATGLAPMDYVRKRRLSKAAKLIGETDCSLVEVCFQVGFNSAENFTRAFKTEHGITPSAYRKQKTSLHLLEEHRGPDSSGLVPEPVVRIETLDGATYCCREYKTSASKRHEDIPRFWNRYHQDMAKAFDVDSPKGKNRMDMGWLEVEADGSMKYLIGYEVDSDHRAGAGERILVMPAQKYAIFKTPKADAYTFVEVIHQTWDYIYSSWLPRSGYEQSGPYSFERYCEKSYSFSEEILISIADRTDSKKESL